MAELPFIGKIYSYRGSDQRKQQATADKNQWIIKIAKHANRLVANDVSELQQLLFSTIAMDLGCDVELVRHALGDGGYNGITFRVSARDREKLQRFVDTP